jgi:phosphate starvation-inducible PhoH-like protein
MKKRTKNQPDLVQSLNNINLDHSPIIPQRSKLKSTLKIYHRELTTRQKEFLALASNKDAKIIFVSGPAGTAKTFLSIFHALTMINEKRVSDLIYVRTTVECSDKSMGFLPGIISDKLSPYLQPLMDKLEELLPKNEIELLQKENRISGVPIGFLRGLNWNAKAIILDEAQNCTFKELFTFITRIGQFSKVFVIGDPGQSDINGKSGFEKMVTCFDDEDSQQNGIYTFRFTEEDIVRSELVKFIAKKLRCRT